MGVITTPFSNYSCVIVLVDQWASDSEGKQHREFLFSGQWLDEINEGAPFSSLSCLASSHSCVGVASQRFLRDYFSRFGWCPRKPWNLITLGNLYPYGTHMILWPSVTLPLKYCNLHVVLFLLLTGGTSITTPWMIYQSYLIPRAHDQVP